MEEHPEGDDQARPPLRPYPAPGRPEQPMPMAQSPWLWVVAGLAVAVVIFGGLLLWVMYEIGTHAG